MTICLLLTLASWQQRVSYEINGYLNTNEHSFTATEQLTYYNNSIHALDTLYFHLYANAYRDAKTYYAREAYKMGDEEYVKAKPQARGYIDVTKIASSDELLLYDVDETVMVVPLNRRLKTGDSLVLEIEFYVKIPKEFPGFGYWFEHYEMTQWYPKMCVFDEEGWHRDQLHPLGSDYGEFGTYDVTVELPGDYVVAAPGSIVNRAEKEFLDTLSPSKKKLLRSERKRVHFHAENVHDFAWVCSKDLGLRQYKILNSNISIYYRLGNEGDVEKTYLYALDVISRFTQWFGAYPYRDLNFVDGFHQGKATYPQMIITGLNEDGLTRLFETNLVMEIGKQWFNGAIGLDGMRDAWLGDGLAAYAAIRYVEDKYGENNTLLKIPFLPFLSLRYFHRFYYYVMQTNGLEKPVSTPAPEYVDVPISYQNSVISKPALFLFSLEKIFSRDTLDQILQNYFKEYTFKHVASADLINICENVSDRQLSQLFDSFLNTTEVCDWRVNSITGNTVEVENTGELRIPANLHVITESGEQMYSLAAGDKKHIVVVHDTLGEIERVAIDPSEYTLDPNYWNNYAPRKVSIKPVFDFDWPSFSTYQILWLPYLWYDSYDGVTAGFYFFGDNFADVDFVRGGYQVTAGYTYGFGSKRHYPSLNYQTPVLFEDGKRVRFRFSGARSRGGDNISVGLLSNLGRAFTHMPQIGISNLISYYKLSTYSGLDSIDWDLGRNIALDNHFKVRHSKLNVDAGLSVAHHALGSEWEYLKLTLEAQKNFSFAVPFSARLFVGRIFGSAPIHERLFLSGALRVNMLANLLVSQSGTYSPQERIHIPGDGNMRGYQTLHIKSEQMYVLNLEFPTRSLIRVFTDVGYYDKFAFDVGVRLVIGAETFVSFPLNGFSISVNLPLYAYVEDEPWQLRWSFGFSL